MGVRGASLSIGTKGRGFKGLLGRGDHNDQRLGGQQCGVVPVQVQRHQVDGVVRHRRHDALEVKRELQGGAVHADHDVFVGLRIDAGDEAIGITDHLEGHAGPVDAAQQPLHGADDRVSEVIG